MPAARIAWPIRVDNTAAEQGCCEERRKKLFHVGYFLLGSWSVNWRSVRTSASLAHAATGWLGSSLSERLTNEEKVRLRYG